MKSGRRPRDVLSGKGRDDRDPRCSARTGALARGRFPAKDRHLHIALSHSATAALINVAQNTLVSGEDPRRWGNAHPNLVPYQLFDARDRQMVIAVGNDHSMESGMPALGLDALAADETLNTQRRSPGAAVARGDSIAERLTTASASHWLGALAAAGVPSGVVRSVRDALSDVSASPSPVSRRRCRAPCDCVRRGSTSMARPFAGKAGVSSDHK
jgi:crotonobetainyl-CoA:carnitine CoA-transferase CaiB-like acyl-CoA transferase